MVSRDACIMAVNAAHWTSKAPQPRAAHARSRPLVREDAVPDTAPVITLSPRDYDAILFDLDGVPTRTARAHAAAWKRLFDQVLEQQSVETGESFVPLDISGDCRRHVDGMPRRDGAVAILPSRRIDLPLGAPDDGPNVRTVHGLGNLKDQYFLGSGWVSGGGSAPRTRATPRGHRRRCDRWRSGRPCRRVRSGHRRRSRRGIAHALSGAVSSGAGRTLQRRFETGGHGTASSPRCSFSKWPCRPRGRDSRSSITKVGGLAGGDRPLHVFFA
jgi:hypothetical protein